ncbi:hypothetical protein [uncultured Campylobacter sp.]|uniref:hypothetical protein n=1 Tax=uncultured Campylobacter sp. TaxID=218934 RepID=UPI00262511C9|nr:hypothetical protein [uncultured Campylobacter sp.]
MKKFVLFIALVASAILANAYDLSYGSSSYEYQELSDRVDELERENRNHKRDAQMRSLGSDDFYRQNLPFDPGF